MLVTSNMKTPWYRLHSVLLKFSVWFLLIVSASISIITLLWFITFYDSGIEFSDEGKYLIDIRYPLEYQYAITNYGLVYHLAGKIVGFNLLNLRLFNLFLTVILASIATYVSINSNRSDSVWRKRETATVVFISSCVSLSFFGIVWILTPSYNSLTFQTLLLVWIGIVKVSTIDTNLMQKVYFIYLGFTLGILFIAKPTSMLLLLSALCIYLIFTNLRNWLWVFLIPATSYITISLFSIAKFGNPFEFFHDLYIGIQLALELSVEYSFFKLLAYPLSIFIFAILIYIFRFKVIAILESEKRWVLIYLPISFASITLGVAFFFYTGVNVLFALLLMLLALYTVKTRWKKSTPKYSLFLLIFPFTAAFGSNNNLLIQSLMYFYFVLLFLILVATNQDRIFATNHLLSWILLSSILFSFLTVFWSSTHPYRQNQSVTKMKSKIDLDTPIKGVMVTKNVSEFLQNTYDLSRKAGLSAGTPILDLTGQSSTLLFYLNAKILADSWLIGGYPGSESVALFKFKELPCSELRAAWLLIEPTGPRVIDFTRTLGSLGFSINDYLGVASWQTPVGAGGEMEPRTQYLLKPKGVEGCNKF